MKICLDAGHYARYNQSPVLPTYYESQAMWQLQTHLKKALEAYGIQVTLTRTDQKKDLPLLARGKKSRGCDLLLSLHSNAAKREDADHAVIFYQVENGSSLHQIGKDLAEVLAPVITKVMELSEKSPRIAAVRSENDRNGDGAFNDNYYGILEGAAQVGTPALILEHSFHTNLRSAKWLSENANLKRLAEAHADAIAQYYDIRKPLYRVQVGAYTVKANAEKMQKKLKAVGYNGFITKIDSYYKVQVGAFTLKENALGLIDKLRSLGFSAIIKSSK